MRLRWWELALGIVPLFVALLWFVGGLVVPGAVLLSLLLFAGASRAQIVEQNVAGAHARARGVLIAVRAVTLFAIYIVTVVLLWVVERRGWTDDTPGLIAAFACAGLAVYLLRDVSRYSNEAIDYFAGGRGERRVAKELEPLRERGWTIIHNVPREGRGNLDHFVSGSTGAYAIETKIGRHRATDRGQAISNAIWAKERFGQRFVTAVLCVFTDPPEEPLLAQHGNAEIWVLGPSQLREWLLAYRWVPKRRS